MPRATNRKSNHGLTSKASKSKITCIWWALVEGYKGEGGETIRLLLSFFNYQTSVLNVHDMHSQCSLVFVAIPVTSMKPGICRNALYTPGGSHFHHLGPSDIWLFTARVVWFIMYKYTYT